MRFQLQLFLFVLLSWPMLLIGQEITAGSEWYFTLKYREAYYDQGYSHIYVTGDTVIKGVACKTYQRDYYGVDTNIFRVRKSAFLLTDTVVYGLIVDTMAQIFKYNLPIGSSFITYQGRSRKDNSLFGDSIVIKAIDSILSNSDELVRYTYNTYDRDGRWQDTSLIYYRDIGGNEGLQVVIHEDLYNEYHWEVSYLRCYTDEFRSFKNPVPLRFWNNFRSCDWMYIKKYLSDEEKLFQQSEVLIYPNPTSTSIQIKCHIPVDQLEFFDLSGKLVESFVRPSAHTPIELSFPKGVYFYQAVLSSEEVVSGRLIKVE